MGGIAFLASTVIAFLLFGFKFYTQPEVLGSVAVPPVSVAVLVFSVLFTAIGFTDDFTKIRNKQNQGLTATQKLIAQGIRLRVGSPWRADLPPWWEDCF